MWPSAREVRTNVPYPHGLHSDSLTSMFIGAEIRLEVGFSAAQARLANLAHGGLLYRASESVYAWGADQAQAGPLGPPGMSRLVRVQFRHLVAHEDSAIWALRWEVTGTKGALLPVLDADIALTRAGEKATVLAVSGAYRPPLGSLGAGLDRAIMHLVAEATIRAFTRQIGTAIVNPAASFKAAHAGMLPEKRRGSPATRRAGALDHAGRPALRGGPAFPVRTDEKEAHPWPRGHRTVRPESGRRAFPACTPAILPAVPSAARGRCK